MAVNKVMIVEDDRAQLIHLQQIVAAAGYVVSMATTGDEAVTKAKAERPDAILMDINMPGMDGFAAIRSMRADASTKDIPVVFVSAKNQKADQVWAQMQGGKGYVTKPYQPDDVLQALKALG
jgi:twitching motility two-component system response regulator PilH